MEVASEAGPARTPMSGLALGAGAGAQTRLQSQALTSRAEKAADGLMASFKQLFMDQAYKLKHAIHDPAAAKELSASKPIRTLIRKTLIKLNSVSYRVKPNIVTSLSVQMASDLL